MGERLVSPLFSDTSVFGCNSLSVWVLVSLPGTLHWLLHLMKDPFIS